MHINSVYYVSYGNGQNYATMCVLFISSCDTCQVLMVQSGWLGVSYQRKEQWKCVWMQCGVACVTARGITRMRLWFADNLDTQLQVRILECTLAFPVALIFICACVKYKVRHNIMSYIVLWIVKLNFSHFVNMTWLLCFGSLFLALKLCHANSV